MKFVRMFSLIACLSFASQAIQAEKQQVSLDVGSLIIGGFFINYDHAYGGNSSIRVSYGYESEADVDIIGFGAKFGFRDLYDGPFWYFGGLFALDPLYGLYHTSVGYEWLLQQFVVGASIGAIYSDNPDDPAFFVVPGLTLGYNF